jgi:uncharacterized protein YkwD
MRKPLVVVCGLAAMVLIAGGVAATTAGADTTPDVPSSPGLSMPDVPALPDLPGDDQAGSDLIDPAQDQNAQDQNVQDQNAQDQDGQDQGDQAGQNQAGQSDQDQSTQDTPQRPGGQHAAHHDGANQNDGNQNDGNQNDGNQHGGPARPKPAAQRPAATTLAAAQREVTPGSVSVSPAAPVQQQVLALVNGNRRRGGCDDLSLDRRLIAAAYRHAADMARRGYFAHESLNGDGAGDRVQGAGYAWSRYGENIARGQESPYEVVDGWMHSEVHRENIMDCQLHQMGIGLAFSPDREPYWVQDFATPR